MVATVFRAMLGVACLAAAANGAAAQPFFRAYGGYYDAPIPFDGGYDDGGYPYARPYGAPYGAPGPGVLRPLDAREIARRIRADGFRLVAAPRSTGRMFVAVGADRAGRRHRLVYDAVEGRLVENRLIDDTRRAAAIPPKVAMPPAKTPALAAPAKIEPAPPADVAPSSPLATPAVVAPQPAPAPRAPEDGTRVRVDKDPLALPAAAPSPAPAPVEPAPAPSPTATSQPAEIPAPADPSPPSR